MSNARVYPRNGRYQVRWSELGRRRAKTLDRRKDAERFANEKNREQQLGKLATSDRTLGNYVEEWWGTYAIPNLQPATRQVYKVLWDKHAYGPLGSVKLSELTPRVIKRWLSGLEAGPEAARKTAVIVQGICRQAVIDGLLESNPVTPVRKPRSRPKDKMTLSIEDVERIRAALPLRDAVLVSVLAYAGLRPQEALALRWNDFEWLSSDLPRLAVYSPKTTRNRVVHLTESMHKDLHDWFVASKGESKVAGQVFPDLQGKGAWRNWRYRTWKPLVKKLGLEGARPYDLRGTYVTLLIYSGLHPQSVAKQAGHSVEVLWSKYARIFEDFDDDKRIDIDTEIRKARAKLEGKTVSTDVGDDAEMTRSSTADTNKKLKWSPFAGKPSAGLEPATPSLPWINTYQEVFAEGAHLRALSKASQDEAYTSISGEKKPNCRGDDAQRPFRLAMSRGVARAMRNEKAPVDIEGEKAWWRKAVSVAQELGDVLDPEDPNRSIRPPETDEQDNVRLCLSRKVALDLRNELVHSIETRPEQELKTMYRASLLEAHYALDYALDAKPSGPPEIGGIR